MEAELTSAAEEQIRQRLPEESLMDAGIIVEPDYCYGPWVRNERILEGARWLYDLALMNAEQFVLVRSE